MNITEDSFSDGGRHLDPSAAITHARKLHDDGADLVELGPASSHPDAISVSPEQERARIERPLADLVAAGIDVSVDSSQPATQLFAAGAGAACLNDVQGFAHPETHDALAAASCALVLMHSIVDGPKAVRRESDAASIVERICEFFDERLAVLTRAGVARERVVLDPGMGFFLGSNAAASLAVLARIGEVKARFGLPVMISVSRKSFLGEITGRPVSERGAATLAAELEAVRRGADLVRTHDIAALRDALAVLAAIDEA